MIRLGRIRVLTLLCCSFPFTASLAYGDVFQITHETDYVYMPLPGTLGESVEFYWAPSFGWDVDLSGLPGIADDTELTMSGIGHLGPLISLDAEWNPDGSIGDADYTFGKGDFTLELMFDLLDGTPHTMFIRGDIAPLHVSVIGDTTDVWMTLPKAKIDRTSAAMFGMQRQLTGSTFYYTDVYRTGSRDRELALFGYVYFDYTPVKNHKSAVPEPATLALTGLGVAAAIRRRRARSTGARLRY